MKLNLGNLERIIRLAIGAVLLILTFTTFGGVVAVLTGIVGAIALVTGLVGYCPLWSVLKINTRDSSAV